MTVPPQFLCPLCGNNAFQVKEALHKILWKPLAQRMTLLVCKRCRYVLHFYDREGIFDLG